MRARLNEVNRVSKLNVLNTRLMNRKLMTVCTFMRPRPNVKGLRLRESQLIQVCTSMSLALIKVPDLNESQAH